MNTPTHALIAMAALSRRDEPVRNRWILFGALIPDLAIFLWAPWQRWGLGRDWAAIWDQHYFEPSMQTLIALFNSVPIYGALLGIAIWRRKTIWGAGLLVFSLAALVHIFLDAPFHGHDAYRHFWPISDWRFYSPISYWEADLHARWVSLLELAIVSASTIILWRRFDAIWARTILTLLFTATLIGAGLQQLAAINVPS